MPRQSGRRRANDVAGLPYRPTVTGRSSAGSSKVGRGRPGQGFGRSRGRDGCAIAAEDLERIRAKERDDRAKAAMETAKERGLELPPMVEKKVESGSDTASEMSREDGSSGDGEMMAQ